MLLILSILSNYMAKHFQRATHMIKILIMLLLTRGNHYTWKTKVQSIVMNDFNMFKKTSNTLNLFQWAFWAYEQRSQCY